MKKAAALLMSVILLTNTMVWAQAASSKRQNVYVVEFTTRERVRSDLAAKFTNDFERALVLYGNYNVLERRNQDRIFNEIDQEKAFADLNDLSEAAIDNLKTVQADLMIFGEVFDDVESGQVNITVTFQAFDGSKVLIKSVLMSRGLVNDAVSRQNAMESLVKDIGARTASKKRTEAKDFLFELVECRMSERTVTCRFLITNNGEDRVLRIYTGHPYNHANTSMLFDDFSAETGASDVELANKKGSERYVENLLIGGRPAEAVISYLGVSSKASTITRLDLACWEEEQQTHFKIIFRNIPIEK